jgi:uncharacterized protein YecT (DUF1311 family)
MDYLLTPEGALVLGLVSAFAGWFGRGIAAVLWRWWTGAPKHDRAAYFNSLADLGAKLRGSGMTVEEVRELEAMLRDPSLTSKAMPKIVDAEAAAPEPGEPEAFHSNVVMKARAHAAYETADAKLNQALVDLRVLIRPDEEEALDAAQACWKAYRRALEDCALREYEGGTHAPLAMTLRGLAETERRTAEVEAEVADRASR